MALLMTVSSTGASPTVAEIMESFTRIGLTVFESPGSWWYNESHHRNIFYAFPPHKRFDLPPGEAAIIFKSRPNVWGLRYLTAEENAANSSIWVCRRPYDLSCLNGKSRNQVRRGLERCIVRRIDADELGRLGAEAQSDTLRRHGQKQVPMGFDRALRASPAFQAWGAFVDERLAAYLLVLLTDGWAHIMVNRSADSYLRLYPNNAVVYTAVLDLLSRPEIGAVSYGWEPLIPHESLEHFKLNMGFVRAPVKQCIVLHPWLRGCLRPSVKRAVQKLAGYNPGNTALSRASRILSFVGET